ncbi:VOC family protein [Acidisphaera sp. L21]|uniref:VOC family protein n=1 Tax=Acidisphaera sp. L21 TaxID=1641851 RepID=UPI00131BF386|nr:VOC family protein [Acidisphaera sp. L21]
MLQYICDHVHLRSADPVAAAKFYVDMFGAKPVSQVATPVGVRVIVDLGGLTLFIEQVPAETVRAPEPPYLGVEHIGLFVSPFDDAVAELTAKQAVFVVPPRSPRPGTKIAFVQAPDGVRVEILERTPT